MCAISSTLTNVFHWVTARVVCVTVFVVVVSFLLFFNPATWAATRRAVSAGGQPPKWPRYAPGGGGGGGGGGVGARASMCVSVMGGCPSPSPPHQLTTNETVSSLSKNR